jgi:hypothetical protein
MGTSQQAEGCSNREAWQAKDVSIGSSQDRSGSKEALGQTQATKEEHSE